MVRNNIKKLLEKECFWDVTLVGQNNEHVNATKAMLGAGSAVFERMFFGGFAETKSETVPLEFSGKVLKAIVFYLYTEEVDLDLLFDEEDDDVEEGAAGQGRIISESETRAMVEFQHAADYFELPELARTMQTENRNTMLFDDPTTACAMLDESYRRGVTSGELWNLSAGMFLAKPHVLISGDQQKDGVATLQPDTFKLIAKSIKKASTLVKSLPKFLALRSDETEESETYVARQQAVADVVAHDVNLMDLTKEEICEIEPSEYFPMEKLYEAICQKVLLSSPSNPPVFGKESKNKSVLHFVIISEHDKCEFDGTYADENKYTIPGENMDYKMIAKTSIPDCYDLSAVTGETTLPLFTIYPKLADCNSGKKVSRVEKSKDTSHPLPTVFVFLDPSCM